MYAAQAFAVRKIYDVNTIEAAVWPANMPGCLAQESDGFDSTQAFDAGGKGAIMSCNGFDIQRDRNFPC